jgi:HSP20 family protein
MGILDIVPFRQRHTNTPAPMDRDRDPVLALQADVERAFGNFWNLMLLPLPQAALDAFAGEETDFKVDVRDRGKEVEVVAELPGFTDDDIEVTVGPDSITIRARRNEQREQRNGAAVMIERSVGIFERTIDLPDGALTDQAAARFKNGVLTIVVPKSAESQSRQRKIKVQAS